MLLSECSHGERVKILSLGVCVRVIGVFGQRSDERVVFDEQTSRLTNYNANERIENSDCKRALDYRCLCL